MTWNIVSLGNICTMLSGNAWAAGKFKEEGMIPIVRIQNFRNNENEKFIWWDEPFDKKFLVTRGDILLSLSGSIKVDIWNGNDALLNQRIVKLTANQDIDRKWFYWQITNIILDIERMGKWALVNNVSITDLKEVEIPLPPLAIQKRIAEILDAADALRRKDQELLKKYDQLAQAIFIDMFGDPVKNEKGWEVKKLAEIIDVDAKVVTPKEMEGYKYIGLEHIEKETGKILQIDKGEILSNKFLFNKDHILYGKLRPYLNKVAVPNFSGICSTDIFPLTPKNKLMKHFLVSILRSKDFVNHSNTNAVGASLPRSNKDVILSFKTIVPQIETVVEYTSIIEFINRQKDNIESEILKSEFLFNSLIQKAFKGELVA